MVNIYINKGGFFEGENVEMLRTHAEVMGTGGQIPSVLMELQATNYFGGGLVQNSAHSYSSA